MKKITVFIALLLVLATSAVCFQHSNFLHAICVTETATYDLTASEIAEQCDVSYEYTRWLTRDSELDTVSNFVSYAVSKIFLSTSAQEINYCKEALGTDENVCSRLLTNFVDNAEPVADCVGGVFQYLDKNNAAQNFCNRWDYLKTQNMLEKP